MNSTLDFSSKLKEARLKKGLSQNAVAEKLNISRQAVSRWETGKGMPDINILPMLAELYELSIDELLGHESPFLEKKPQDCTDNVPPLDETTQNEDITTEGTDVHTAPSHTNGIFNREYAILMLILIFSSFITFVSLIVPAYILIWTWRNRRHYKLVLILSVVCLLIGLNHLIIFIISSFPIFTTGTIEKVA